MPKRRSTISTAKSTRVPGSLRAEFTQKLLHWHRRNRRLFPWRINRTPYKVLLAELMLQRTNAKQVSIIFPRIVAKYPKPSSIALSRSDDFSSDLRSLGLQHRTNRIRAAMDIIRTEYQGKIPSDENSLLEIPGVGPYIAAAVQTFGYGFSVGIVDVNVIRLVSRYFGLRFGKRTHPSAELKWFVDRLVRSFVSGSNARIFNEAILDFAAMVCSPKPKCVQCPLNANCRYFQNTFALPSISDVKRRTWG